VEPGSTPRPSRSRRRSSGRDGKFPALFDTILADAGIQVVLSGVRIPRTSAVMERWIKTYRSEQGHGDFQLEPFSSGADLVVL
jgi:transposase InsO family protein